MSRSRKALEKQFLAIAGRACRGADMEPWDGNLAKRIMEGLMGCVLVCFHAGFIIRLLDVSDTSWLHPHWTGLLTGVSSLALSLVLYGMLRSRTLPHGGAFMLFFLPVPGAEIARRARARFFLWCWWPALHSSACAWKLDSMSGEPGGGWALQAALLLLMTVATPFLLLHSRLSERLKLPLCWLAVCGITGMLIAGIHITDGFDKPLPAWVADMSGALAWLLPAAWVMPGFAEGAGIWLAAAWMAAACWRCWRLPALMGPGLELPVNIISTDNEEDEEQDDERDDASTPDEDAPGIEHGRPSLSWWHGWIEKLARRWIAPQDAVLAAAILDPAPAWSRLWLSGLRLMSYIVVAAWLARWFSLPDPWFPWIIIGCWAVALVWVLPWIFPLSNMLGVVFTPAYTGSQKMSLFSILPLDPGRLLSLSTRQTAARCAAFLLLGLPMGMLLELATVGGASLMTPWIAVSLAGWIFATRPLLIAYRMQQCWRASGSAGLGQIFFWLVQAVLMLVWLCVPWVFQGSVLAFMRAPSPKALMVSGTSLLIGLLISHGMLALFIRRWKGRGVDMMKPGP